MSLLDLSLSPTPPPLPPPFLFSTPPPLLFIHSLVEEGGDWDRRNRLKVYRAVYAMQIRDFKTAAVNFFDAISTFTSTELMDYRTFVKYAAICCMVALPRSDLKSKVSVCLSVCHAGGLCTGPCPQVIQGASVLEVLHGYPELSQFVHSLYHCQYDRFFRSLSESTSDASHVGHVLLPSSHSSPPSLTFSSSLPHMLLLVLPPSLTFSSSSLPPSHTPPSVYLKCGLRRSSSWTDTCVPIPRTTSGR